MHTIAVTPRFGRLVMEDVFEQTLAVAPLTETALFAEVTASIGRYAVARKADWQGQDARGGCKYDAVAAVSLGDVRPMDVADVPPRAVGDAGAGAGAAGGVGDSKAGVGFFASAAEAAGGGRRGADFARALQRWLVAYVDSLALDEIEEMAK